MGGNEKENSIPLLYVRLLKNTQSECTPLKFNAVESFADAGWSHFGLGAIPIE